MALTPNQLAELERRGVGNIRRMMQGGEFVGVGPGASVPLGLRDENPRRSEVEDWLAEKERQSVDEAVDRHSRVMFWAKIAGIAAVVGAVAAIVGVVVTIWTAH